MRRKILLLLIIFSASALSFNCQTTDEKTKACKFLSFAEAEKILGGKVELVTNSWTFTTDITRFDCTYRAVEKDKASGKDINLYFSFEQQDQNATVEKAREVFASTYRKINEPDIFVGKLSGVGDEAFLISNPPNFHFMMVRKGTKIFRIKLNKAGKGTSLEELKTFMKKAAEQI
ncbi:MAG TPA: hypothetical protein VNB22_11595 [Pyrinomonadaceae bacterium]|jgi:hypothetical protein|nr:hypothetical protein [Pyrinomonadaceae bacterium]